MLAFLVRRIRAMFVSKPPAASATGAVTVSPQATPSEAPKPAAIADAPVQASDHIAPGDTGLKSSSTSAPESVFYKRRPALVVLSAQRGARLRVLGRGSAKRAVSRAASGRRTAPRLRVLACA